MPVDKHKSKNVSKPLDQRVVRTREQIDAAFVAILHRRAYDGIRVSDITRKAGLGRATFYAHYATKHDLLQSQLQRIVWPMIVTGHPTCPVDCTALFAHVLASPRIYQGLMAGVSGPLVSTIFQVCFEQRVQQLMPLEVGCPDSGSTIPTGLVLRFMASSLLSLVQWCVETSSTQTPAQMQVVYAMFVSGTLGEAASVR